MKLRLTAFGFKALLFYGIVVFVHFAASYANLFFLLLCFATSLGLVALLGTWRNLRGVRATVAGIDPVPVGTTPRVRATIDGDPVAARVEIRLADGRRVDDALPRGNHRVSAVRLVSTWPLGLFRAILELDGPDAIAVFPRPIAPDAAGAAAGDGAPRGSDGLAQPSSLREYRPGDPLRRIHWRAMARRGEPVVAEWEAGCGEGYEFLVDQRADPASFERALGRLVGYAQAARDRKVTLTLHTQDRVETYGSGHRSWNELWRVVAGLERLPASAPAPAAAGTHVVRLTA